MKTPFFGLLAISLVSGVLWVRPAAAQEVRLGRLTDDERQQQQAALNALETLGAKVSGKSLEATTIEIGGEFRGEVRDLEQLKKVLAPAVLIFSNERASDDWMRMASQVVNLRELHLYKVKITDEGFSHLAGHSKLEVVGLYYTSNTDRALIPLQTLPQLEQVKLYGTQATPNGVDQFRNQATKVTVDYRRGAFLGLGLVDKGYNPAIAVVHIDSPAANSGLSRDDVLIRCDSKIIGSCSELIEIVSQHEVGDTIDLEVARHVADTPSVQTIARKIKLGPFPLASAVQNRRP